MSSDEEGSIDSEIEESKSKKIGLTKCSISANLNFNVNSAKKWVLSYIKNNMGISDGIKIHNAHIAITAFGEELLRFLVYSVIEEIKKNKVKLYEIEMKNLENIVKVNNELYEFYGGRKKYDDSVHYIDQYFMEQKLFDQYMENEFGSNINIVGVNLNYLFYLLTTATSAVLMTGEIIREYSKKTTLSNDMITCAVKIHMKGNILKRLLVRIEAACDSVVETRKKDKEKKDKEKEDKEPKKETKKKDKEPKKETKKKPKKEIKKKSDDEDDNNNDEDE